MAPNSPFPELKLLTINDIIRMPLQSEVCVVVGELNFTGTNATTTTTTSNTSTNYNWNNVQVNWDENVINDARIFRDSFGKILVMSWNGDLDLHFSLLGWINNLSGFVKCEPSSIDGKSYDELPKYIYKIYER